MFGLVEIAFDSLAVRTLCEDALYASSELGPKVADSLRRRIADLRAATTVSDLLIGRPRPIEGNMMMDLSDGYTLIFGANHVRNPAVDNEIAWDKVSRVKILGIQMQEAA